MQIWDLHLNDPECRGVEIGDDYVFTIKTNLTDCGTIMVSLSHSQSIYTVFFMAKQISFQKKAANCYVFNTYMEGLGNLKLDQYIQLILSF